LTVGRAPVELALVVSDPAGALAVRTPRSGTLPEDVVENVIALNGTAPEE
jgi:hypothetical protein